MGSYEDYRQQLRRLPEWDAYLLAKSGLPGPRGNLELAAAAAAEAAPGRLHGYLKYGPTEAPEGTSQEFLAFCGVLGLAADLASGGEPAWRLLRSWASDPRWRIREAVAMALQHYGDADTLGLLNRLDAWVEGRASNGVRPSPAWPSPGCCEARRSVAWRSNCSTESRGR